MVTQEQAFRECLSVVGEELPTKILTDKYFLCDENKMYVETTPKQMWKRLAKSNAVAEKPEKRDYYSDLFYELLTDWKFMPAGRVMYGLGNPFVKVSLKNCYQFKIQEDSMKGIFDMGYWSAETYKTGGGCGIGISALRPKGSIVHNAARFSSGAVNFMDFYSTITGMIGQMGRIGALLLSIDVSHPDIEDFIKIKGGDDLNKVRYANISIQITDKFMQAVCDNQNFPLEWGGKVYREIPARQLWDLIIKNAWGRAEPGLLFWDAVLRECPTTAYELFRPVATNPCFSGDSRLLTADGNKTMRQLWEEGGRQSFEVDIGARIGTIEKYGKLSVVNRHGVVPATKVYKTGDCEKIFKVTFDNGSFIKATPNHHFITTEGIKFLSSLEVGDMVNLNTQQQFGNVHEKEYARLAGWVIGDGSLVYEDEVSRALVRFWDGDIEHVLPQLRQDMNIVYKKYSKNHDNQDFHGNDHPIKGFDNKIWEFKSQVLGRQMALDGNLPGDKHKVPSRIWQSDRETVAAFLCGLFSADGGVQVNESKACISIRLSQSALDLLYECQILLNQFGIISTVYPFRRKADKQLMNDGKGGMKLYDKKAQHELVISGLQNCKLFMKDIRFIQDWKNNIAESWFIGHPGSNNSDIKPLASVKSIDYVGVEETFCLTEPSDHEVVVNGIVIGQCGESPGGHGDSCNLGSYNLGKFVIDPWSKACHFDYKTFTSAVRTGVRFMDNIITLEKSPLPFQQKMNDEGRRVGLGVMGLADVFLKFGIRYDSEEARQLTEQIMQVMRDTAYDESCNLSAEKGKAPAFDVDKHFQSPFIQRLPKEIKEKIKKNGQRNLELLSIAPTGSLSSVAGCSAGCEPVFMMHHIRKTNLGTAKEVKAYEVWHSLAKEYAQRFNVKPDKLPDFFVNAHQIDNMKRIKLQATMQKYVCQAISNTFNLPKDATVEQISELYMAAWRSGLKGITVYREGSREGVLTSVSQPKPEEEIIVRKAPKRPESIDAVAHIIKPNGKTFIVFVGLLKGRVFEVFVLDHKIAGVSDGMTGRIFRENLPNNERYYHFESGAMLIRKLNSYEDNEASLITRLVSSALRHGTPLEFLIDQMTKSKTVVTSMAKAIARALAIYVNKDEAAGKLKCDKCGSHNIQIGLACKTCADCGFSSCS